jgi:hypothetical protein
MSNAIRPAWAVTTLARAGFASAALLAALPAQAAEGGLGFYLLGSKATDAAILPPVGVFYQNDFYFYQGSVSGTKPLPIGLDATLNAKISMPIDLHTVVVSTPWTLFGGHVAFSISAPIGGPTIDADVVLGPLRGHQSDSAFTVGDPLVGGVIGWDTGDFHFTTNVLMNIPAGVYNKNALANISFHHWGVDLSQAVTWRNAQTGLEASLVGGFTFNAENPATYYRSGTEFHAEWSLTKSFGNGFSAGLVGYYYDQLTGDSGSGAVLGSFEGRVVAVGATAAYAFNVGKLPVSARLKVDREVYAANRAQGTAVFATVTIPLYVANKP